MDTNKIREAETPPSACASCFGQYPDRRHVDFGAYYDGPMVPSGHIAGGQAISVDDLIVCEECLRAAARVLGLVDPEERDERLERALADLDAQGSKLAAATEYIGSLERTQAARANLEELLGIAPAPPEATPRRSRAKGRPVIDAPQA